MYECVVSFTFLLCWSYELTFSERTKTWYRSLSRALVRLKTTFRSLLTEIGTPNKQLQFPTHYIFFEVVVFRRYLHGCSSKAWLFVQLKQRIKTLIYFYLTVFRRIFLIRARMLALFNENVNGLRWWSVVVYLLMIVSVTLCILIGGRRYREDSDVISTIWQLRTFIYIPPDFQQYQLYNSTMPLLAISKMCVPGALQDT